MTIKFRYITDTYLTRTLFSSYILIQRIKLVPNSRFVKPTASNLKIYVILDVLPYFTRIQKIMLHILLIFYGVYYFSPKFRYLEKKDKNIMVLRKISEVVSFSIIIFSFSRGNWIFILFLLRMVPLHQTIYIKKFFKSFFSFSYAVHEEDSQT